MVINGCGKIIQIALDICTRFPKKEFTSWQEHLNFLNYFSYDERIQLDLKNIAVPFERIDFSDKLQKENERKIVFFKLIDRKYRLCYGKYSCQSSTPLHSFHFYEQDYDGT